MPASIELPRDLAAIDAATASKAQFETAGRLFNKNNGHLRPTYRQQEIDQVFRVARYGTGRLEIVVGDMCVCESAVTFRLNTAKDSAPQTHPP